MRMKSTIKNCATIAPRGPGTMPPEFVPRLPRIAAGLGAANGSNAAVE